MRNSALLLVFGLLISSRVALSQTTAVEWENYLSRGAKWKLGDVRIKEQPKPQQWEQINQRETMGQKCSSGIIFTFAKTPAKKVQQKECVDSAWVASVHTWEVRVVAGEDPELWLDKKLAYYLRIVPKDGTSQLRFTKSGRTPAESTIHYYFKPQ